MHSGIFKTEIVTSKITYFRENNPQLTEGFLMAKESLQVQFIEVGKTGVFIARTQANQENSVKLLNQNGFRALTTQEALTKIDQNQELKEKLKGRWLYLGKKGTELSGFYMFNEKGELTKISGPAILKKGKGDLEKIVFVLKGSHPLSLLVQTDDFARYGGFRFGIYATYGHSDVAGVVVGVRV